MTHIRRSAFTFAALLLALALSFWLRPAQAALSKPEMVDILKVVDDRQKNNGDWRASAYLEQKEKDKVDVVYETEYYRRSEDQKFMILFTKPKSSAGQGYLRLDKTSADVVRAPGETFQLGKSRCLRGGSDLTLIASGGVVKNALAAADRLEAEGIDCRVLSMHTVKPLDAQAVFAAATETGGILTIEEHTVDGGLGGAVAELCLETGVIPKTFHRMGLRNGFCPVVGSQTYLQQRYNLDGSGIRDAAVSLVRSAKRNDVSVIEANV